jgi:protein-S-isoprenylcysteine O-methyltransferase Ste14
MNKIVIRVIVFAFIGVVAFYASALDFTFRIGIAAAVGIPAFALMMVSRRQLGESFSVMPAAKALIVNGVYSRIQHPMYVFLDVFLASTIVALGYSILVWLWGVLIVVQILQSHREETVLRSSFGAEYDLYTKQTWI